MAKTATSTAIELKLRVPEATHDIYYERSAKLGRSVETEMAERLRECRYYTAAMPIYLNDEERQTISRLAGRSIVTPSDLIAWATGLAQINVQGVHITLDEGLLARLESRTFGRTLSEMLHETVIECLEKEVGLR